MQPSQHIGEPAGRMVNNHGHWDIATTTRR